jgi:Domain of unknown function (DUF4136)
MKLKRTICAVGLLLLTVGFVFGQKVRVDFNHNTNFFKYKTYTWIQQPVTPNDPLMAPRIVQAVDMQLMAKGLKRVDSDGDLGVSVNVATQEKQTLNSFYDGFGWGWGLGDAVTVETYTEGTIVADLFDAMTKKIVWRGVATKEISSKPEKVSEQAQRAIEKLFKHFPPNAA